MKDNLKTIDLGQGLGDLKFGMSREMVKEMLGEPSEIDNNPFDDEEGARTETWHYDDLKLSLSFQEPLEWELDTISVTDAFYEIDGASLIGKDIKSVQATLEKMDITDLEKENHSEDNNQQHTLLTSDAYLSNFWFDQELLTEIQWGPEDDC